MEAVSYEPYFYLYDDGENRVIYYGGHNNEDYGETVDGKSMRRITLQGEAPSNVLMQPMMSLVYRARRMPYCFIRINRESVMCSCRRKRAERFPSIRMLTAIGCRASMILNMRKEDCFFPSQI